ncbi:MAG: beta-N-acetylglucosaminidase domain-containing protein [Candidatus Spyradenecus sp.]
MRKRLCAAVMMCAGILLADVLPESMRVYPTPQEVTLSSAMVTKPKAVKIVPAAGLDADAARVLGEMFKVLPEADFTVAWTVDASLPKEGYTLALTAQGVAIAAADGTGFFYAAKTLKQLFASGKAQAVTIKDWPAVPFRGTVEGFYGQPWSFEARKSHFRFYGDWKMNTYIYGPKDDPYHGFSTRWRDPYPEAEAQHIAELVRVAHENKVNFVWAVHPGRDIQWRDDRDIQACVAKFERMYALGVRSFAVFFDDIGGEGARAEMQVKLLNTVNRQFVRAKGDVTPLILCPTQYNKAWSGGTYLETLGTGLDPDIQIMWTGDSVCTDISKASMEWINAKIGRKAYIWWNWPVADYCRAAHLLLGRTYGLAPENGPLYAGFVSNPMDKPEASKIGLFGVADYCWNPTAFNSKQAWKDGIRRVFPYIAQAVQCLADHNSDQGPNGHGYRREESVEIKPAVDRLTAAIKAGQPLPEADVTAVRAEFVRMAEAGQTILTDCRNPLFLEDVANWCQVFTNLGWSGEALMDALTGDAPEDKVLSTVLGYRVENEAISKAHAAKPFQKNPTEVATLVMKPFHTLLAETVYDNLWRKTAGRPAPKTVTKAYEFITNVPELATLEVTRDGQYVKLPKVHEPKTLQPGQWVGIRLPNGVPATWVHFHLEHDDAITQGRLQLSTDGGQTWGERAMVLRGNGKAGEMEIRHINPADGINAIRYINISDSSVLVTLAQLKVDVPKDATANVLEAMVDGDLNSAYTLQPGETVTIPLTAPVTPENAKVLFVGPAKVKLLEQAMQVTATEAPVTVYEVIH